VDYIQQVNAVRRFVYKMDADLLPENLSSAYKAFFDSAQSNDILEPKTTVMISIATSMAIGCYP